MFVSECHQPCYDGIHFSETVMCVSIKKKKRKQFFFFTGGGEEKKQNQKHENMHRLPGEHIYGGNEQQICRAERTEEGNYSWTSFQVVTPRTREREVEREKECACVSWWEARGLQDRDSETHLLLVVTNLLSLSLSVSHTHAHTHTLKQ